jgi:HEAT repeat protein
VDLLLTLLNGKDESDSFTAAMTLGQMGKDAPLDLLLDQLYDEHGEIRSMILQALASMGEYAPLDLILRALESVDQNIRRDIEYVLSNLARAMPAKFVELTRENRHPGVRQALMEAVGRLGKDAPVELALAALEDENQWTRFKAREALLKAEVDPDLLPIGPLLDALRSESWSHQAELGLLAKLGARAPVEPILALLGASDDNALSVISIAAEALYKTHPEVFAEVAQQAEAILRGEPIGSMFASRVQSRVANIVQCLGQATAAVLDMVSDLLDWPYWEVRMRAARALGAIHRNIPDRAIRRLIELRRDPEAQAVCKAADEALVEILSRESGMEDE